VGLVVGIGNLFETQKVSERMDEENAAGCLEHYLLESAPSYQHRSASALGTGRNWDSGAFA